MIRKSISCWPLLLLSFAVAAQRIATFEIELPVGASSMDVPVRINLDEITSIPDSSLTLTEVQGSKRSAIAFQIFQNDSRQLVWIVKAGASQKKRIYELASGVSKKMISSNVIRDDESLTFRAHNKNLLRYRYKTMYPPAGVDTAYKRSGFIHPLWSPRGQELTRIQPPDHYHHYGIWNPWTHVLYKGDTIDFWNLKDKKGTVRFSKFVSVSSGPVFSEIQVLHEHVVLKLKGNPVSEVALHELQTIRVYQPDPGQEYFIVDLLSEMNCATENPFRILLYRYAGLGWRTTQQWDKLNSEFLSSEGKTRKDADGTKARWFTIQGSVDGDYAGAQVMSYPGNYNHPEPMRIWPENQYDRGDVFVSFAPTKDKDWLLEPGKKYVLKYRFVVYNGHLPKEKADFAWQYFAKPPSVVIRKN